jgi:hypothetical protein
MDLRLVGAAVVLLGSMASFAAAGDKLEARPMRAQPVAPATLQAMGLSGMRSVGESEGHTVRGKFTFAFVRGFSRVGGNVQPYADAGANNASGFRAAFGVSGGGFGFAFGGANAWAN